MSSKFEIKTYNGVSIIINTEDNYVNASQMCSSNGKKWRNYKNSKVWTNTKDSFERRYQNKIASYYLNKVAPKYQGEYIHPKLVHFVAEYCSSDYAFAVSDIMDSINEKLHEELEKKHLQDVVEIAKPLFKEIAKNITNKIDDNPVNNQCWGYRDNVYSLDAWEKDDLNRDIDNYNDLKMKLAKARAKVDGWSSFIPTYRPDFEY